MMKSRSTSISRTCKGRHFICGLVLLWGVSLLLPTGVYARIFIDINAPSIQRIKVAIPDLINLSSQKEHPELATAMTKVLSNDLDLTGYFAPMDKAAFLEEGGTSLSPETINFKNWSIIGTELLIKGGYVTVGQSLEVELRMYDVFWGREIMGKRALGKVDEYRELMHRLGNDVVYAITGFKGMFLSKMAFVGTATGHKEIYVCDFDGHNVKQITFDQSIALLPRWSPKGDRIIYNSYKDGGPMLYLKDLASGRVSRVSSRNGLNIGACWSPNDEKLALTLSDKGNPDIYMIDLNGNVIRKLTDHWGIDVSPTFSPDGGRIAFVSNRSGSPEIYIKDLGAGTEQRLTFEGNYNTSPVWSSSNMIAYSGVNEGAFDICTIDPEGGNLKRLTGNQGNNEDPWWSPDGRYIVFSSNRDGGYHLYIMNANGQNQRRITFLKGEETSPSWSPY